MQGLNPGHSYFKKMRWGKTSKDYWEGAVKVWKENLGNPKVLQETRSNPDADELKKKKTELEINYLIWLHFIYNFCIYVPKWDMVLISFAAFLF